MVHSAPPPPHRRTVGAAAPTRVAQRLRSLPDGPLAVLHRGPHAVYVDAGGWCLGVVAAAAVAVPCALRIAAPDLGSLATAPPRVRAGVLHLGDTTLPVGRLVDVRVPTIRVAATKADEASVARLVRDLGLGPGLTPETDDDLCGWLAVHRAAGVATPTVDAAALAARRRTTLLSATLLECAVHGEVIPEFAAWLRVLDTPDEPARAAGLARLGHTSGAALLRGARLALSQLERIAA